MSTYNLPVTGFPYRPIDALKCDPTGQFVQLKHEPYYENTGDMVRFPSPKDDPDAVQVWFNGKQIGWLPKPKDSRDTARNEIVNFIKEGREIHVIAVSCAFIPESEHGNPKNWFVNYDITKDTDYTPGDPFWHDLEDRILYRCSLKITVDGQHNTEEGRHYMKDGKKYRSISEVVSELIPHEGDKWDEKSLNIAARYGNIIHKIAEHDFTCYSAANCYNPYSLTAYAISDAVDNQNWNPVDTEKQVFDDTLLIAGTYDAMGEINQFIDKNVEVTKFIVDFKSSKTATPKHKAQVAFYAKNADAKRAFVICFGSDNKKGYSVCEVDIEREYNNLKKLYEAKLRGQTTN